MFRQLVPGVEDADKNIRIENLTVEDLLIHLALNYRYVDLVILQHLVEALHGVGEDGYAHVIALVPVFRQDLCEDIALCGMGKPNPDAGEMFAVILYVLPHLLIYGLQPLGIADGYLPLRSELELPLSALDYRHPKLFFQKGDVMADRRLRERQDPGGTGKAPVLG